MEKKESNDSNNIFSINTYIDRMIKSINSMTQSIEQQKELTNTKSNLEESNDKQDNLENSNNVNNKSLKKNKVWYTNYRGYIVKSVLDQETGVIHEKMIPYNQPSNFRNFLNNYFENELN